MGPFPAQRADSYASGERGRGSCSASASHRRDSAQRSSCLDAEPAGAQWLASGRNEALSLARRVPQAARRSLSGRATTRAPGSRGKGRFSGEESPIATLASISRLPTGIGMTGVRGPVRLG